MPAERGPSGTGHDTHTCAPPIIGFGTMPAQPDWECATCRRLWRDMRSGPLQWWAEIRGPSDA